MYLTLLKLSVQFQILVVPDQQMEGERLLGHRCVRWILHKKDVEGTGEPKQRRLAGPGGESARPVGLN